MRRMGRVWIEIFIGKRLRLKLQVSHVHACEQVMGLLERPNVWLTEAYDDGFSIFGERCGWPQAGE